MTETNVRWRESVPPGGCDTHADNLNRLAARLTDFRLCGREADEDKAGQHVSSEAVSEYKRLDEAARSCSAPRRGFRRRLPCFDERAKGLLINNLVTFSDASCSELWCSSIPHESHEEIC